MTQRTPPVWSPYDLDAIENPAAPRLSDVLRMQAQRAAGVLPQDRPEAQADGSGYYRQDSPYLGASQDALTFANRGNFGGGLVSWVPELLRGEGRDGSFADRLMNTAEAFSPIQAAIGAGQSFDRQARHLSGDTQYDMTTPEGRQESFMDVFGLVGMLPAAGVAAGRTTASARPVARHQGRDLGVMHGPEDYDYGYGSKPRQDDWMLGYSPSARMQGGQDRKIGLAYARDPDMVSEGVDVIRGFEPAMPKPGQDAVRGVRGIDGRAVYSNPDDPTTAGILALLTEQQGADPQQSDTEDRYSVANGLRTKDNMLWHVANANKYTPLDHISPTRELRDLYKDGAYGMPLDPYLNGGVAMGGTIDKDWNVNTRPADKDSDEAYINLMQYGLHNPITALGASDPSRMALRDGPALSVLPGYSMTGTYFPHRDVGWASTANDDYSYGGKTVKHEFTHRGYKMLRDAYPELRKALTADLEHTLIAAQDELNKKKPGPPLAPDGNGYRPPTDEDRALLADLIAKAQDEIYKKRPYGGPR